MKITIESTDKLVTLVSGGGEVQARVWEGHTASGIPVVCLVTRISPDKENPPPSITAEFERELQEQKPPRAVGLGAVYSRRMVL